STCRSRRLSVRLHFQKNPWDLYAAALYMILMLVMLVGLNAGGPLAIFLQMWVPGYVVLAAFFPGTRELSWPQRLVLSLGLSIVVVPLLGLALNFTPPGILFVPIVLIIELFTAGVGAVAYWRRMRLPV